MSKIMIIDRIFNLVYDSHVISINSIHKSYRFFLVILFLFNSPFNSVLTAIYFSSNDLFYPFFLLLIVLVCCFIQDDKWYWCYSEAAG
jgi:hypothetical protein